MESSRLLLGDKVKEFIGLSRMTHSILDIAHPALGAILAFGGAPGPTTIILGLIAAFAGFTAVFALNDVMDCRVDCEKMGANRKSRECFDLDSVGQRHPVAQGLLRFSAALAWVIGWGALALVVAFLLNPLCALFMAAAAALEIGYCRLLKVTHWKTLLSGLMVGVGGLAGCFAVVSAPPLPLVALFFFWAFTWEVGGRNIPNDWSDLEEDAALHIRTIPVRFGRRASTRISVAILFGTVLSSLCLPLVATMRHPLAYLVVAFAAGAVLLFVPALRWLKDQRMESSLSFFNGACFYPLAVFAGAGVLSLI